MINLIPPEGKKTILLEYRVRVLVVSLFLIFGASCIVLALSVPVLVLVRSQLHVYEDSYTAAEAKTDAYTQSTAAVGEANKLAAELYRQINLPAMSPFFDTIDSLSGKEVTIESFSIERAESGNIEQLTISGTADTRASLAHFKDRIEADKTFASANLPISNLAKDKDVPFTIVVFVAPVNKS